MGIAVRAATTADADAVWRIFAEVVATGDTYAYEPDTPRDVALAGWLGPGTHCHVAERDGEPLGTYTIRANQPGLGAHVANGSFMVAAAARGCGVGRAMGEHALEQARRLGFRAMQFNLVVADNAPAVALWAQLGFEVVGRLPGAFHQRRERYVDALVMYRTLV